MSEESVQLTPADLREATEPEDIINLVSTFWKVGKSFRDKWGGNWKRFWRLYLGDHWDLPAPVGGVKPKLNMIFSFIETLTATITANRPRIIVNPRTPEHADLAYKIQKFLDHIIDEADLNFKLPIGVREMMVSGNAFLRPFFNPTLQELDIDVIPPTWIVVEPSAIRLEDAQWVILARPYSYDKIRMLYPEETEGLVAGIDDKGDDLAPPTLRDRSAFNVISPVASTTGSTITVYGDVAVKQAREFGNMVRLTEAWFRRDIFEWQHILIANNKLIFNQNLYMRRVPIVHLGLYRSPFAFWAIGDVQQVYETQLEINFRRKQIADLIQITANPAIAVDPASGFEMETRIRAGTVLPAHPDAIKFLQPPSLPSELFTDVEMAKRDIQQVIGNPDILQGIRPVGVESGKALQNLYEFANVRVLQRVRTVEAGLKELAEILIDLLTYQYPPDLLPKNIMTLQGAHPEYVQLTPLDIAKLRHVQMHVELSGGSLLPTKQSEEFQIAVLLFQMGLLSGQELLRRSGLENWKELVNDYEAKLKTAAALQTTQQQLQPTKP